MAPMISVCQVVADTKTEDQENQHQQEMVKLTTQEHSELVAFVVDVVAMSPVTFAPTVADEIYQDVREWASNSSAHVGISGHAVENEL